jgi:PAS domain S-box-containing protein
MTESLSESSATILSGLNKERSIKVLHVDDDLSFLKVAKQCLEMQGEFQVETACSVDEAIEKMKKRSHDVIVSDYQMPGKDGLEFLEMLRKNGNTIPFIMFTGKGREEVAVKAWSLGADHYVNKTGDPETAYCELAHCLRSTVENARAQRLLRESEEKYRDLFENAMEAIVTLDLKGSTTAANNSALRFGYKREDLVGKNILDFVSKEYWPAVMRDFSKVTQGESAKNEIELVAPTGRIIGEYYARAIVKENNVVGVQISIRDVTERKKAEEALKSTNEKLKLFSTAAKASTDGFVMSDLEGRILEMNEAALKLYEANDKSDLIGKSSLDLIIPEEREKLAQNMREGMAKGHSSSKDISVVTKKGARILVDITTTLVRDTASRPVGFLGIIRDITERKKAEEELKSSQERLRILFESAPDAYYLNDLRGNFLDGNKAAEEITGYSKSELVGKSFLKLDLLLRSQIPKAAKLLILNAMGKPTGPDEFILNRKDRTQVQVEIRTFPTKIQDQKLVLGIARDITERKKTEKLILESQQRFAALFSNNPEATVYTDPSMHILDINPRFTSLFGYSLNEVKGRHLNTIVVPDSHIEEAKMLDSKTGEGYIYHDTVRKRKDGSLIPVSISAASISIQGQLAGIVGVYKDISEQTSSRKKLVAMNEKLRVVGGLTRHDVRNKLAAIVGNTYLVKKEMAGNEKVLDRLEEIEKAVQQSVKIFDFAKTYEMLGAEEMTYVDVGKTVKDAASLFTDLKDAKVINDCRGLDVFADSLLQQLFYNLIDNSLKYGQKMTTTRVHYEESGKNYLELVYEDDGVGIPVAGKTNLFTEGYSTGGSTGYGLYLIKKMVEVYGWTIKETGEPGKGARFLMTIPKTNESGKINYRLH